MTDPAPPLYTKDDEHVRLLGIFSFVVAGLGVFGLIFLAIHYGIMSAAFNNPEMWRKAMENQPNPPPFDPTTFFHAFRYFYLFFAAWGIASIIVNMVAGLCLLRRRQWIGCLIVAGFNCINFPFGMALGIFTFIVLLRESVRLRFVAEGVTLPVVPG
jgi:hypothetical protein